MAIAVLVLGLGWWFWPRVDQRLVGKWRSGDNVMHFRDDGIVDRFVQFDGDRFLLRVEGIAKYKVVGDRLIVFNGWPYGWQRIASDLRRIFVPIPRPIYDGQIIRVTSSEITLRGKYGDRTVPTQYVCTRVEQR